jgi:hypothetical protein
MSDGSNRSKKYQTEEILSIVGSYPLSKVSEDPTIKRWMEYIERGKAIPNEAKH